MNETAKGKWIDSMAIAGEVAILANDLVRQVKKFIIDNSFCDYTIYRPDEPNVIGINDRMVND